MKYAVRRRFPELPGESVEVGRDYLEKLIQFPIHIPPLDACEMETYISLLFAKAAQLPPADFEKARSRVLQCDAASLMTVRFNLGVAVELFGSVSPELESNLSLAERIAPILAAGLNGKLNNRVSSQESRSGSRRCPGTECALDKAGLFRFVVASVNVKFSSLYSMMPLPERPKCRRRVARTWRRQENRRSNQPGI